MFASLLAQTQPSETHSGNSACAVTSPAISIRDLIMIMWQLQMLHGGLKVDHQHRGVCVRSWRGECDVSPHARVRLMQSGDSLCLCSQGAQGITLPARLFNKSSICPECPVAMVTEAYIVYFSALFSLCVFSIGLCLRGSFGTVKILISIYFCLHLVVLQYPFKQPIL